MNWKLTTCVALAAVVAVALLATLIVNGSAFAQTEDEGVIARPEVREPEFGSLATVLQIAERTGKFQVHQALSRLEVGVDFYEKGELKWTVAVASPNVKPESDVQFAFHTIDTDYLPVTGAKPGHVRCSLQLQVNRGGAGTTQSTAQDVPKMVFGKTGSTGTAGFAGADIPSEFDASGEAVIPLFAFVSGTDSIAGNRDLDAFLHEHRSGNVAAGYVRLVE